jgi:hypothetical protein
VPLSEHEQRLLEQLERQLYAEDPKFATAMRGSSRRSSGRRAVLGTAGLVIGLALLVLGVANGSIAIGLVGFLLMLAGTIYAFTPQRRTGPVGVVAPGGTTAQVRRPSPATRAKSRKARSEGFMARLEERWERRRNGWG